MLLTAFALSCVEKFLGPSPIDSYITTESSIAKAGILANIGPDGSKSSGASVRQRSALTPHIILELL